MDGLAQASAKTNFELVAWGLLDLLEVETLDDLLVSLRLDPREVGGSVPGPFCVLLGVANPITAARPRPGRPRRSGALPARRGPVWPGIACRHRAGAITLTAC